MNWPDYIPVPYIAAQITAQNAVIRTDMESGLTRQRRRFANMNRLYSVKWSLSKQQSAYFQSFVYYQLQNGTLFFDMPLDSGDGIVWPTSVRFVNGAYSLTVGDGRDEISATIEAQNVKPLPVELIELMATLGLSPADLLYMDSILHPMVHETVPETLGDPYP